MDFSDKKQVRQFIEENDIRDIAVLNKMLKNISGVFIEQILEAEQADHLGYEKYERTRQPKTNVRNGYGKKKVRGINGERSTCSRSASGNVIGIEFQPCLSLRRR